jgi:hypothetical protein
LKAGRDNPAGRIRRAFELALNREPTASEAERLGAYAERHGLAGACRLLFNANEFIFID